MSDIDLSALSPEETAAAVGPWATAADAYELRTVDVPAEHWIEALTTCRDALGLGFFDWLSAVDELAEGFSVCAHLVRAGEGPVNRLLLRTRVPRDAASLPSAVAVYAGAAWHERETHEMFGIDFTGHPHLITLLLPDGFEGHPLRKEFVLAARVAKAWPGAKEPGESDHAPAEGARRRMLPPGVPDPNEWGPLKGTLPPAPERPARGARAAAAGAGPATDRPRRTRSVASGSTSQTTPDASPTETPAAPANPSADAPWQSVDAPAARPRRSRSVSEGSASQPPEAPAAPAPDVPASASPAPGAPAAPEAQAGPDVEAAPGSSAVPNAPAAPEATAEAGSIAPPEAAAATASPAEPQSSAAPEAQAGPDTAPSPSPDTAPSPDAPAAPEAQAGAEPAAAPEPEPPAAPQAPAPAPADPTTETPEEGEA